MVFFERVGEILEKEKGKTTGLYSAASMLSLSLSAACQSLASRPRGESLDDFGLAFLAMGPCPPLKVSEDS